jgi:hypothetical protein
MFPGIIILANCIQLLLGPDLVFQMVYVQGVLELPQIPDLVVVVHRLFFPLFMIFAIDHLLPVHLLNLWLQNIVAEVHVVLVLGTGHVVEAL